MDQTDMFSGKTAVITGAGRGIGLCIADAYLQAGGNVIIADADATLQEAAIAALRRSPRAVFIPADVADETEVAGVMQQAVDHFGRLDAVVHNAAVADNQPLDQVSSQAWRRVIDTNVSGAFLCAKYAAAPLRNADGAIVLIASTRAIMSEPNTEAYSASKAGLVGLTHALAMSLAPVRVNCISPGWIVTDAWQHGRQTTTLSPEDHAQHPVGRVGYPEDIAAMALYLCSRNAAFITGQNIVIDGGMTKKMIYR